MINRRRKIVVLSGISAKNLGDDAMLVATVRDLLEHEPSLDIKVLAERPSDCAPVADQIGVPIIHSPQRMVRSLLSTPYKDMTQHEKIRDCVSKLLAVERKEQLNQLGFPFEPQFHEGLWRLMTADGVIDCGGASLSVHWKSYFFEKCLDYLIAAKPLFVTGQQVDRFDLSADRDLLCEALSKTDLVTLREGHSERYLRSFNDSLSMRTTADDALTLRPSSTARVEQLIERSECPRGHYLAFQYRHYLDYDQQGGWDVMASYVDAALAGTDLPIIGVPMHFDYFDEREHLKHVRTLLKAPDRFYVLTDEITPGDAKGIFGSARLTFGISYHSAVLSLSAGTPYLGLYLGDHYARKMEGLAELYGDNDMAVHMDKVKPNEFEKCVRSRLENYDFIQAHLDTRHAELEKTVKEVRQEFIHAVQSGSRNQPL